MSRLSILQAISISILLSAPACTSGFSSMGNENGAGTAGEPPTGSTPTTCQYAGKTYPIGQSFRSSDGCNTCACNDKGEVGCTLMACAAGGATGTGGASSGACSYNGTTYAIGQSFKSNDGCNTCFCDNAGRVGCTEMACANAGGANGVGGGNGGTCLHDGRSYSVGQRFESNDGCNTCWCDQDGEVACTLMGCFAAGGATGVGGASGATCNDNGKTYTVGQSFRSSDGCNTCFCGKDGMVDCTDMGCPAAGGAMGAGGATGVGGAMAAGGAMGVGGATSGACVYNGSTYPIGQTFKSNDGCNTCFCGKDGQIGCTVMACFAAGGMTGAAGTSGNVGGGSGCPGYPTVMPVCSAGSAVMQYDTNACEIGYICSSDACACSEPKPLAPNVDCSDGSMGGPICAVDTANHTCAWQLRSCPATGAGGATGMAGAAGAFTR